MNTRQYLREAKLKIAGKEFTTRIAFEIHKGEQDSSTTGAKSNKSTVSVFNISEASRGAIEYYAELNATAPTNAEHDVYAMVLEAGYRGALSTLFVGDIATVEMKRNGPDIETVIEAGDGERRLVKAHVEFSMDGAGVNDARIFQAAIENLGLSKGAIFEVPETPRSNGFAYSGPAADLIDQIAKKNGLAWSVHNGAVNVRKEDSTTGLTAILLTDETGLIGIPNKTRDGFKAECLLNPELEPGCLVKIKSMLLSQEATYMVKGVDHVGDTHGDKWMTTVYGVQV